MSFNDSMKAMDICLSFWPDFTRSGALATISWGPWQPYMICTDMLGILPLPYMIYPFSFFLFRGLDTELGIIPYIYTQYMSKVYPCCFRLQRFLRHCLTLAHTMYRRTEVCIADGFCVGFPISKWSTPGPHGVWGVWAVFPPFFLAFPQC
jgi:hypothetical protein